MIARILLTTVLVTFFCPLGLGADAPTAARVRFDRNDAKGELTVRVDGKEALVYKHHKDQDMPYYFPVRSPSGKSMTIEFPKQFPHHRSFYFADRVKLAGHKDDLNFYGSLYAKKDPKDASKGYKYQIRHLEFLPVKGEKDQASIGMKIGWMLGEDTVVLAETRTVRVVALGEGEYFLDMTFTLEAPTDDVTFTSDWVHYAWPFVRLDPAFSVQQGGKMVNSEGGENQKGTNGKDARWVDYSGTVEGTTEGLALMSHSDNEHPHWWLTRDYGTFGPRRIAAKSGKPFTLKKGQSITTRCGALVHKGDVQEGKVAQRYREYVEGKL